MEEKKTHRADLENQRTMFFLMGFAAVLSAFFVMLEWRSEDSDYGDLGLLNPYFIESELQGEPAAPMSEHTSETPETRPEQPETEAVVHEDYRIVEKLPTKLEADEILQIRGDTAPTLPELIDLKTLMTYENSNPSDIEKRAAQAAAKGQEGAPQFPGGNVALVRFIHQNLKYPEVALKQRIQGRVWCSFVVDKDGAMSDLRVESGVYSFLDDEALRVLRLMPQWSPAVENGRKIASRVYLPIVFKR
ncbi:MAG: TonB family protein [Dysgonamonadaceae bacterium]|jgi:protein TonB|nr:TonB family protein [Dysgonamonadaceae bacterium]